MFIQFLLLFAFTATSSLALSAGGLLSVRLIGTYIEEGHSADAKSTSHSVYEFVDNGRFLKDRSMFARTIIAPHWVSPKPGKPWRTIDLTTLGACEKAPYSAFPTWRRCKAGFIRERHHCTPTALEGCEVDVRQTPYTNFVYTTRLQNGSWLIATKHRDFCVQERNWWHEYPVPTDGVVLADVPANVQVKIGSTTIVGDTTTSDSFAYKGITTTDLVPDRAAILDELRTCKVFELASKDADYNDYDEYFIDAYFFFRCANANSNSGSTMVFYVAFIVAFVIIAGSALCAVKVVRARRARPASIRNRREHASLRDVKRAAAVERLLFRDQTPEPLNDPVDNDAALAAFLLQEQQLRDAAEEDDGAKWDVVDEMELDARIREHAMAAAAEEADAMDLLNDDELDRHVPRWDDEELETYASLEAPFDQMRINDENGSDPVAAGDSMDRKRKQASAEQRRKLSGVAIQFGGGRLRKQRRHAKKKRAAGTDNASLPLVAVDGEELLEIADEWPFSGDREALDAERPIDHFMVIQRTEPLGSKSRHTVGELLSLRIRNMEDAVRPDIVLEGIIGKLLGRVKKQSREATGRPPRLIGMEIASEHMQKPFYVPQLPPEQNTPQAIAAAFERLAQSNDYVRLFQGPLNVKVTGAWFPRHGCRQQPHRISQRTRSMTEVINPSDNWCLPRAVVIGLAYADGERDRYQRFRSGACMEVGERARQLLESAGLRVDQSGGYDIRDVEQLQRFLNELCPEEYRLVVFQKELNNTVVYKGPSARKNACLYLEGGHYNHIGQPWELFKSRAFCVDCERPVWPRTYHPKRCRAVCQRCLRYGHGFPCAIPDGGRLIKCQDCHTVFANQDCFDAHKRTVDPQRPGGGRSFKPICKTRFICPDCRQFVDTARRRHQCPMMEDDFDPPKRCEHCDRVHTPDDPYCYIQPWPRGAEAECGQYKDQQKTKRYVWFDVETTQNTPVTDPPGTVERPIYKHEVNVLISHHMCVPCIDAGIDIDAKQRAPGCVCGRGKRRRHYVSWKANGSGQDPAHDIILSHNGGNFDIHFVAERLNERGTKYDAVMSGLKIYSLEVRQQNTRRVTFKDSLNFFLCRLDKLVPTFDLQERFGIHPKPFFPYLYNTAENLDVPTRRRLPRKSFYCPDEMAPSARTEFLVWHTANKNKRFNLRKELLRYCENDVDILRLACLEFRRLLLKVAGADPFVVASTIAKLALNIYRQERFLPRDSMLNAPEGGFRCHERQSVMALRYMRLWEQQHPGRRVQTSEWAVGEARFKDGSERRMDGRVDRDAGRRPLAIEFLGCYYHGCPRCYPKRTTVLAGGVAAVDLYNATMERRCELEQQGHLVHMRWECDFARRLRKDKELREQYRLIRVTTPLDPREDALRGGRTEAFRLHYQCRDANQQILYVDVNSLYPYVMKTQPFPTGKPQVLTKEAVTGLPWRRPADNPYLGLLKVRVVPPTSLRRPLLPYRTERIGRLVLPLCATCAEECRQRRRECRHSDDKRAWIAAYTHCELNKALSLGYVVTDVFEAYHYPEEQWTSAERGNGLFTGYINTFFKLKVEASGWPEEVLTEEQQIAYAERYLEREGVELDRAAVGYNEGLRFIAKILLNSLWGKLAQRYNLTKVAVTKTPEEFWRILANDTCEVLDWIHLSDQLDRVTYRKKQAFFEAPRTNNIPVAAFVTSHARLRLYHFMEQVPEDCLLYCDTDTLIYVKRAGQAGVEEGDALGEMNREMRKRRIVEFLCGGPKNYGLRHVDAATGGDEKTQLKVRGFTLNYSAQQRLTFDTMRSLIRRHFLISGTYHENGSDADGQQPPAPKRQRKLNDHVRIKLKQITRTARSQVFTRRTYKTWQPVFTKAVIVANLDTRPYGYRL